MKRVVILAGGMSSERDISLESGQNVLKALLSKGYDAMIIDVQHQISTVVSALEQLHPDVVFNALHGKYGEDGCVQGLLNMMKIPYTHSGVLASALSMDKQRAKEVAHFHGIDVPAGRLMTDNMLRTNNDIPMPYVVKPNDEGSSVGVFIIRNKADEKVFLSQNKFSKPMLVEEYIPGRELSVVVTDTGAVGIVEIIPMGGFYDYEHKYTSGAATHIVPANVSKEQAEQLLFAAETAHKAFGCRGVSRSDFRLDEKSGRIVFLELNANPGMTTLSLVPEVILTVTGKTYAEFVANLVEQAMYEG